MKIWQEPLLGDRTCNGWGTNDFKKADHLFGFGEEFLLVYVLVGRHHLNVTLGKPIQFRGVPLLHRKIIRRRSSADASVVAIT